MAHEVETIAYAHSTPWHGLGNRVDASVTVDEMLVAAGLDWEVRPVPATIELGGKKVPIGRNALVRSSDGKILSVTGPDWTPFQNRDALEFFREYTEAGGATLETAGSLRGGRIVWGLARVNAGFSLNGRDHVNGYILLVSPHEIGKSITVRTTSIRVVCANTLAMAGGVKGRNAEYRQSHVHAFNVTEAKSRVQLVKEQIAAMELEAKALQSLKMSEYDSVRFLAKFFQPAPGGVGERQHVEALIDDPSTQDSKLAGVLYARDKAPGATPGNGWGVLNGVTYYVDHMAGRAADTRLFNSWLGEAGKLKSKVKDELMELTQ